MGAKWDNSPMADLRAKDVHSSLIDRAHIAARLSGYTLRDFIIDAVMVAVNRIEKLAEAKRRKEKA